MKDLYVLKEHRSYCDKPEAGRYVKNDVTSHMVITLYDQSLC